MFHKLEFDGCQKRTRKPAKILTSWKIEFQPPKDIKILISKNNLKTSSVALNFMF